MKKINFLFILALMSLYSFSAKAATIQLASGDVAGVVKTAVTGDIIELTTDGGAYTWKASVNVLIAQADITIRAAVGLTNRPVITVQNNYDNADCFNISAASNFTLQGVEIQNRPTDGFNNLITTSTTANVTINIDNCKFSSIKSGKEILHPKSQPAVFTLNISNSIFALSNNSLIYLDGNNGNHVTDLSITNTLFSGTSMSAGNIAFLGWGNSFQPNSISINHCTFNGNTGQADLVQVATKTTSAPAIITNCLFVACGAASSIGTVSLDNASTGVYPVGNLSFFPTSGASTLTSNPALDGSGYASGTAYVGTGTDGKNIGYYNQNAPSGPTPTIITTSTMTAFGYTTGSGPSSNKSFTVGGSNLTADIVLTAPTNYEISTSPSSGYASSVTLTQDGGTVATITIYTRLVAGLSVASYSGNITVTSVGAVAANVAVTGSVIPIAGITQLAAGADVSGAVKNAVTGDIIELITDGGAYTWKASVNVLIAHANITVRAAAGLTNRPVITVVNNFDNAACFNFSSATNFTLQGVEIKNSATDAFNNFITTSTTSNVTINIDNCKFSSIKSGKDIFHPGSQPAVFTLNIANSIFALSNNSLLYLDGNVGNHVTDLSINNTLFTGTSMAVGTIAYLGWGDSFQPSSIVLNHCTFAGNTGQADLVQVTTKTSSAAATIVNCLFDGSGAASSIGTVSLDNANTGIYPAGNLSLFSTAAANTLTADPVFNTSTGSSYGVATGTAYYNAGTDSKTIGYYGVAGLGTSVSKLSSENRLSVIQNGSNFRVIGAIENAAYSVYAMNGCQLKSGIVQNNLFNTTGLRKGIYILKSNNQVAKFNVR